MSTRLLFLVLGSIFFFGHNLLADRIHLKNGQILQGKAQSSGQYWLVETSVGILKIKKIEVAWVDPQTVEDNLPLTPSTTTKPSSTKISKISTNSTQILKKLKPSRTFQEKFFGDSFRAPASYYYGPTAQAPIGYYTGVLGPNYFFGTLGYSPIYSPSTCYSSRRSGLHFSYRYQNNHWGISGSNFHHSGYYHSGNFSFRFRSSH